MVTDEEFRRALEAHLSACADQTPVSTDAEHQKKFPYRLGMPFPSARMDVAPMADYASKIDKRRES